MRRDQPRRELSVIQLPNGPNPRFLAARRVQLAIDFEPRPERRVLGRGDFVRSAMLT
jgi:hypothetical protein